MKKKTSKVISIVLTLCMILSCMAVAGFTVSAKDIDSLPVASEPNLQDNVQDGVILHAFNWSYNAIKENLPAIAAAGYSTVQTSPVQQPKDYGDWYNVADQWSKLYQPLSFSIATDTWLGTKEELASLCEEAHKYGVKIICDVVTNHLANNITTSGDSANLGVLYTEVAKTEPEIYNNQSTSLHSYKGVVSDSSVQAVVQGYLSECPDLNTGSELVQSRVISLLEECIDCGVDGFRFDAAKHIETPDDGAYASDYWPNVTGAATAYAQEKYQKSVYYYGEILNTCGPGRKVSSYTPYINVTDNTPGNSTRSYVRSGNATTAAKFADTNSIGADSKNSVLWAESHDTYMDGSSANVSDEVIIKTWALVAAQSDATSLFFARPGSALMGEAAGNTSWKSIAVSEINKFHNAFVGTPDKTGASGPIAYVARGDKGIVLVNCSGTTGTVNVADTGLADGTYTDTITGNKFTVSGGTVSGTIGDTGVAVVYNASATPTNTVSVESGAFRGNTLKVTIGLVNATSGTYQIGDAAPVTYTDTTEITIGSGFAFGSTITLTLTATDGNQTTTSVYKYVKTATAGTGVYAVFDPSSRSSWSAPFYVYAYDEDSYDETITNAAWPGEVMDFDEETGYYYYELPESLANAPKAQVIINNGKNQYPTSGSRTHLWMEGKSHLLKGSVWEEIDFHPAGEEPEPEPTTETPTTEEPTTEVPTEEPTSAPTEEPTSEPEEYTEYILGDSNCDDTVDVKDATNIQLYAADYITADMPFDALASDVNLDGVVDIKDATQIQLYAAKFPVDFPIGEVVKNGDKEEDPTEPETTPTDEPTVVPTEEPTEIPTEEPTEIPTEEPTEIPTEEPTEIPTEEPTTEPTEPEEEDEPVEFFVPNYVEWLTDAGASFWVYNDETGESVRMDYDPDGLNGKGVYYTEITTAWQMISIYRQDMNIDFDKSAAWDKWENLGPRGDNNSYRITASGTGTFTTFDPDEEVETLKVVYFDNTATGWDTVYIYGWGAGLSTFVPMTRIEGTNIWYYEFSEGNYPVIGTGSNSPFLFVGADNWSGGNSNQTADANVPSGCNMFVASSSFDNSGKRAGTWTYYAG